MPLCRKALLALSLLCLLSLNAPLTAQSTGKCGFQTLNIPAPAGSTTRPMDLSDTGAIVGLLQQGTGANFHTTGFLFSGGQFAHFRFPGSTDTFPADINKSGEIVGTFKRADGTGGSFMVKSGAFSQIKVPGFPNAPTVVTGVNDLGDTVGFFSHNNSTAGFLVHQGKLTIISFPGADLGTSPSSVNNEGVVIGTYQMTNSGGGAHGFMWQNGNFTNIVFPDAAGTQPTKINDKGVVVGDYEDTLGSGHGFSFINGTYTTIDRVTPNTLLLGLNNFNNIVGLTENDKGDVSFKGFCASQF